MTIYDKANKVIGQPYDAFKSHCWHLVEFLQPLAPKLNVTAESIYVAVKNFDKEFKAHSSELDEVDVFIDGDIILLGRGETLFHAGVFLNGGIIHADTSGVVYEKLAIITHKYPNQKGLRCRPL